MATRRDYYEVLGTNKSATADEIKSAYRKLARQHHPDVDKTPGAENRFKEISEAYQVLSDPEKRKAYDQFGHAPFEPGGGAYGGQAGGPFGGFKTYTYSTGRGGFSSKGRPASGWDFGGFEDPFELFEQIFGMGGMGGNFGGAYRRNPTYEMDISFEDAVSGTTRQVELSDGRGGSKRMTIKVPPGVDNGTRMRFEGVDIVFRVRRHPEFLREGADIFTESKLTIPELVLGTVIEVNTISGLVNLKVPQGTEPGSLIRIKGKGVPVLQGRGNGDHYVTIKIEIPKKLSAKEKELYEQLLKQSSKKSWF